MKRHEEIELVHLNYPPPMIIGIMIRRLASGSLSNENATLTRSRPSKPAKKKVRILDDVRISLQREAKNKNLKKFQRLTIVQLERSAGK